jgi:hypothetical protein
MIVTMISISNFCTWNNNHVEGCQEAHPNIFKSNGIVKDIATETAINYKQLEICCHLTKRNRNDTIRDLCIDNFILFFSSFEQAHIHLLF